MEINLVGIVHSVGEVQVISDKFSKRDFILKVQESDGDFEKTQYYPVQLINKATEKLSPADSGKEIEIKGNLDGRIYVRKTGEPGCSLQLSAWFVKLGDVAVEAEGPDLEYDDSLPF